MGYPVLTAGLRDGAARHRHDGRDDARRPPDRPGRPAAADRRSASLLTASSLWQMTRLHARRVAVDADRATGVIQGFGLGFMFVPLRRSPSPRCRRARAPRRPALFSLMRNIGCSIGISIVVSPAGAQHPGRCTPRSARHVTPFNRALQRRRGGARSTGSGDRRRRDVLDASSTSRRRSSPMSTTTS